MMYSYILQGYDDKCKLKKTILVHEKEFTNEEFTNMCREAPRLVIDNDTYIEESILEKHLINVYKFKKVEPIGSFIFDCIY